MVVSRKREDPSRDDHERWSFLLLRPLGDLLSSLVEANRW